MFPASEKIQFHGREELRGVGKVSGSAKTADFNHR